ncbi:hypothetical protein B0H16DRAFT_1452281 [Mycena metata]|uniref:BTB domain-containing protein n=1 Tax=Mycena metata TaxID=1033252 RepID=A0AAD7NPE0_9AGAR|nr:hypothetical protein B0H16DRAFT_1452281 [Mycena metata]
MEKVRENWDSTTVTSVFSIALEDAGYTDGQVPAKADKGLQYTAVCGFGWRFAIRIETQTRMPVRRPGVLLDRYGQSVALFSTELFFDPHFIRLAAFKAIIFIVTEVDNVMPKDTSPDDSTYTTRRDYYLPNRQNDNGPHPLGSFVWANNSAAPTITFTLEFPANLGLALPRAPPESTLKTFLEDSIAGKDMIDIKFYAFNRFGSGAATHPLPLFARASLLRGFSDDLDNLLEGKGFAESSIVDLDEHGPVDSQFDGYGYDSDSDLDSEGEDEDEELRTISSVSSSSVSSASSSNSDQTPHEVSSSRSTSNIGHPRRGRVVVLKDTAHKTWKALLYYLYTRRINFSPLRSEGSKIVAADGPRCSPKSMYRLADKLGLNDLKAEALQCLASRLSEGIILHEVFSSFTSMYPAVQKLEVEYLMSHFTPRASEGLKEMTKKICEGEKAHCTDTLYLILQRMGTRT